MSIKSFLIKVRQQKAIWWKRTGTNVYREDTFDSPIEIDCRWEEKNELRKDDQGQEYVSKSFVMPDRSMTGGDYLKLGEIDSSTPESPLEHEGAHKVREANDIPDLKNTTTVYEAYL